MEKIGDQSAPSAPPGPMSLPEPCRHHVVPHGAWAVLKELFRRFGQDQCPAYAEALAFFSILSLLRIHRLNDPMLPGSDARTAVEHLLGQGQANVEQSVKPLIQTRGIAGIAGI